MSLLQVLTDDVWFQYSDRALRSPNSHLQLKTSIYLNRLLSNSSVDLGVKGCCCGCCGCCCFQLLWFWLQGLLALEGELTPILVQMVKSANMNGLLDSDSDSLTDCQQKVKTRLHEIMQKDLEFTQDDYQKVCGCKSRKLESVPSVWNMLMIFPSCPSWLPLAARHW